MRWSQILIQLPWQPEIGWVASDLWMDGKPVEASPRVALKRQLEKAKKKGKKVEILISEILCFTEFENLVFIMVFAPSATLFGVKMYPLF